MPIGTATTTHHRQPWLTTLVANLETDRLHWWYWMASLGLLGSGLTGVPGALSLLLLLTMLQVLHYRWLSGSFTALTVQVRIAALLLFVVSAAVPTIGALLAVALLVRCTTNYCLAARVLRLMPWNRQTPLTLARARAILLTPPSRGTLHDTAQTDRA